MTLRGSLILMAPLGGVLLWCLFSGMNVQTTAPERAAIALAEFDSNESALQRDLLSARAGLLRNYDPINQLVTSGRVALARLRATGTADAAAQRLTALVARQEEVVERFKSANALLQNGLVSFHLFCGQLEAPGAAPTALTQSAQNVAAAMLQLTLDTSPEMVQAVSDRLDLLAVQPAPPSAAGAAEAVLAYGRLLRDLLPATDGVLKTLIGMPFAQEEAEASELIASAQQRQRMRANRFRALLGVISLLLLGQVGYLGLQLRRRRLAAQRQAACERAVASLSVRLISPGSGELTGLVGEALAQLATMAGADRAYFMINGTSTEPFVWARPGVDYPPGWPQGVAALAASLTPSEHGIIHIRDRRRLPNGPVRETLAGAAVRSWTFIAAEGRDKLSCMLGLDSLRAERYGDAPELRLMRMAFDAIANAVSRDILSRDRVRLEQSVQRSRQIEMIASLTSGVAHNFNNIVGTILGYTEMIDESVTPEPRLRQQVAGIRQAGERARTLIEQIMGYGRKRDARRRTVDLRSFLADTVAQLGVSIPRSVRIVTRSVPDDAVPVAVEPVQLQQVIVNLGINAAQAMNNHGDVVMAIDKQTASRDRRFDQGYLAAGTHARLMVSDTGRGMEPELIERIFEPFFTTRPDGNGLGLATVRDIVQEHGGALNVESTIGIGSRFEVWLPCAKPDDDHASTSPDLRSFGNGETVLLLSDDPDKLLRDEEVIAALGYEPVGFGETAPLLAAIRTEPDRFDVAAISVADLPAEAAAVSALKKAAARMPIIILTAAGYKPDADRAAAVRGCDVVCRSPNTSELAAALRLALEKAH